MVSIVYMCLPPSPNSFHPLVPLGIHVCSPCQHLSALQLSLYHFARFHIWVIPYSIYSSEMSFNSGFTSERKGSISFQGKELTDQRQRVETGRRDVKSAITDGNGCWAVEPHDISLTGVSQGWGSEALTGLLCFGPRTDGVSFLLVTWNWKGWWLAPGEMHVLLLENGRRRGPSALSSVWCLCVCPGAF